MEVFLIVGVIGWLIACIVLSVIGGSREIGSGKAFLISALLSPLIGAIFVATSPTKNRVGNQPPHLPTHNSASLDVSKYVGERGISLPAYQLFLTRRFGIEKNATLEKYVIGDDVFNTLDDSLREADSRYEQVLASIDAESERANRRCIKVADDLAKRTALHLAEEAALEPIRVAIRKRWGIIALVVGATVFVGIGVIKRNADAEIQRLEYIKSEEQALAASVKARYEASVAKANMNLSQMYSANTFFGHEIGSSNLVSLLEQLGHTFPEVASRNYDDLIVRCEGKECMKLSGGGSPDSRITRVDFTYCTPHRIKADIAGNASDNLALRLFILTGVKIHFLDREQDIIIYSFLNESIKVSDWKLDNAVQTMHHVSGGIELHRKQIGKQGEKIRDACGNKWGDRVPRDHYSEKTHKY